MMFKFDHKYIVIDWTVLTIAELQWDVCWPCNCELVSTNDPNRCKIGSARLFRIQTAIKHTWRSRKTKTNHLMIYLLKKWWVSIVMLVFGEACFHTSDASSALPETNIASKKICHPKGKIIFRPLVSGNVPLPKYPRYNNNLTIILIVTGNRIQEHPRLFEDQNSSLFSGSNIISNTCRAIP